MVSFRQTTMHDHAKNAMSDHPERRIDRQTQYENGDGAHRQQNKASQNEAQNKGNARK